MGEVRNQIPLLSALNRWLDSYCTSLSTVKADADFVRSQHIQG
jgi:hypothetical protein